MTDNAKQLKFRVSSGLKNIIGRDLISDRYIAIFELVKNSYDARAHDVKISFESNSDRIIGITVSDDGVGMNYSDIINKWLFVAYSEKKKQNRKESDYRNEFKRNVAGAKGVGRFSCDRLGAKLRLITKKETENIAHYIDIDWNNFEYDDLKEFMDIPVEYHTGPFPNGKKSGAILEITELREGWDRNSIIRLKKSLMKLINPDLHCDEGDRFGISIFAPSEIEADNLLISKKGESSRDIVNGPIVNDVFEKLNIKTTSIILDISEDGKTIKTELSDRGVSIFSFIERNTKYADLRSIHISLFYLNRSAKTNFTRQMGTEPVNYGSVFVYKNGFRIYPYGEPNEDFFGIDRRKGQGYNRFLGTREIMGRISISGDNDGFIETSSRAHGFILTKSVEDLSDLFLQKVLKVLERYVVNIINWNNPIHSDQEIKPEDVADRIISEFADLSSRNDILSIEYNEEIFSKASKVDSDELATSISKLEKGAEKTQNTAVSKLVADVKKRTSSLKKQNTELEKENRDQEAALRAANQEREIQEKQVFFLKGAVNANTRNLMNGMHSVFTQSEALKGNLKLIESTIAETPLDLQELIGLLSEIKKSNQKINKIAELAIHGAQNLKAEKNEDIYAFIAEYLMSELTIRGIKYELNEKREYMCYFDSASIGLIIDNIFSNSLKAHADSIIIDFSETPRNVVVKFYDNGIGLRSGIDPERVFEYGATTTSSNPSKGFGIGLCYIKQLLSDMGGSIEYDSEYKNGFGLIMRLKK